MAKVGGRPQESLYYRTLPRRRDTTFRTVAAVIIPWEYTRPDEAPAGMSAFDLVRA